MSALRNLQLAFAATVLRREPPDAAQLQPNDARLARRLMVYRVNARENFAAALESAYPVLLHEMGAQEFRSLAWSYQSAHPSPSGNLFEVGRRLPDFMAGALTGTADEYLRDIARLEWAVQEALVADDSSERFDPTALAAIPVQFHDALRFRLHPTVRILALDYPVLDRWERHQSGGEPTEPAGGDGAAVPERMLVWRSPDGIMIYRLDTREYDILAGLAAKQALGEVAAGLGDDDGSTAIGSVLARWVTRGVITGFSAAGERSS